MPRPRFINLNRTSGYNRFTVSSDVIVHFNGYVNNKCNNTTLYVSKQKSGEFNFRLIKTGYGIDSVLVWHRVSDQGGVDIYVNSNSAYIMAYQEQTWNQRNGYNIIELENLGTEYTLPEDCIQIQAVSLNE